jgi:hypothetical protein
MKQFFVFTVKIILLLLFSALALDFSYSFIFSKSTERNKVENVINSKAKSYDVIILGSSRANNHFKTQLFIDKGLKAYNYGMSGSRLQESALLLKLMLERNYSIKNVIVEVDLNINSEGYSEGTRARFMPFLKSSKTISAYYKKILSETEFNSLYYVPFYRYIHYDSEIGFRELFFASIAKPSAHIQRSGFYGLRGEGKNMHYDMQSYSPKKNKDYELIKTLCAQNKINLISLTTPICENVKNRAYFAAVKKTYPEIHNYEDVVTANQYFSSCGHMNEKGAEIFTQRIIKDFFK